ncbi:MAG TPA: rod shape-determining protein RodA [bacterium]|nr:rod shape-determining protein RodA [bacterium]
MFDRRLLANFDWTLLLLALTISLIGVAGIYSASKGYPGHPHFWLRQLYWIGLGLVLGFLVLLVDFRTIGQWSYLFHGGVCLTLIVLLVVGAGDGQVDRWFNIGPITIQPSEFAKFTTILAIAYYLRDGRHVGNVGWRGLVVPLGLVAVPFLLIVNQPDLGTALMLPAIFLPIIVLAGLRLRLLMYLGIVALLAIFGLVASFKLGYYRVDDALVHSLKRQGYAAPQMEALAQFKGQQFYLPSTLRARLNSNPFLFGETELQDAVVERGFRPFISYVLRSYQQKRLLTFINPEKDPLGAGYHVIQSRVAIGSGGFLGKGFGHSTQGSLNFLPARHTDFIFSIFAEEWGFLGAVALLALYTMLILRAISVVFQTHDRFSAFVTMGVTTMIGMQVLINIGMAAGLLPVVGVPLPFFSYGGSSMITMMVGISILLNIRMRRFLWS